ncbi:MAG: hypothetical protein C5B55_06525 [Blastocatellia bacterium]|nr:MAG: hypothetical protein C5B55_06525 [Blastocatellia bacterium]
MTYLLPRLTTCVCILFVILIALLLYSVKTDALVQRDDARAKAAFLAIIPVLKHPRCLNCHANGDFPRQGDDNHIHAQNVRRGPFGHGVTAQKCSACHQEENVAGLNMPPGAPNWHLPPPNMPMIWEGKTPGQICQQMKDPKQNHGKSVEGIVEHVTSDKLVLWGWNPGEGRTLPPISHDEFAAKFQEWAKFGAACPD